MLMQSQQVEMCYMGIEDAKNAKNNNYGLHCEPQLKFCWTIGSVRHFTYLAREWVKELLTKLVHIRGGV